jgi:hypothetical protein
VKSSDSEGKIEGNQRSMHSESRLPRSESTFAVFIYLDGLLAVILGRVSLILALCFVLTVLLRSLLFYLIRFVLIFSLDKSPIISCYYAIT